MMACVDASDLYLRLYDVIIDDAEYLQPDDDARHMLPDALVIGALGASLAIFAKGFLGKLGERAGDGAADKIAALFKRAGDSGDRDALLEALGFLQPELPSIAARVRSEREAQAARIAEVLAQRGFPKPVAAEVARVLLERLDTPTREGQGGGQ